MKLLTKKSIVPLIAIAILVLAAVGASAVRNNATRGFIVPGSVEITVDPDTNEIVYTALLIYATPTDVLFDRIDVPLGLLTPAAIRAAISSAAVNTSLINLGLVINATDIIIPDYQRGA